MKTGSNNAWWREMGAISRGMMFIEGNIATPASLDRLQPDLRPAGVSQATPVQGKRPTGRGKKAFNLYEDLLFLGGRPMTAGHNDDIEESFPQTGPDSDEAQAGSDRFVDRRRSQAPQPQRCATC